MTNIIADKHAARGRGCGIPTQAQVYFYTSIYVVHCCSNLREREEFSGFFTCQVCNHHAVVQLLQETAICSGTQWKFLQEYCSDCSCLHQMCRPHVFTFELLLSHSSSWGRFCLSSKVDVYMMYTLFACLIYGHET